MTERWLLAAEADQIQDLVFRASQLREVIGGSQLVERFCREVPDLLLAGEQGYEIVVQRGGAFRILFQVKERAQRFGADLAEAYRRLTGGSLTVAPPVAWDEGKYQDASARAHQALAAAKRRGRAPGALAQLPHGAICASCGIGLAYDHARRRKEMMDEPEDYLCEDCASKFAEPFNAGGKNAFLTEFRRAVRRQMHNSSYRLYGPPGGDWAGMIGALDPTRNYVAYLSADGNRMGQLFGHCHDPAQARKLSMDMADALRQALARQCADLIRSAPEVRQFQLPAPKGRGFRRQLMPMAPLIIGGDDLYALLPARWALTLAHGFIRTYEQEMATPLAELDLPPPTLSAALVICKANYPHTLAHRRCERELIRAKQIAHHLDDDAAASVLTATLITGNQTGGGTDRDTVYQATLAPFVLRTNTQGRDPAERLIHHRRELKRLAHKRRVELEHLFDDPPNGPDPQQIEQDLKARWLPHLDALRTRIRGREPRQGKRLEAAIAGLGEPTRKAQGYWAETERPWQPTPKGYGHALGDLLRLWDFLEPLPVDQDRQD